MMNRRRSGSGSGNNYNSHDYRGENGSNSRSKSRSYYRSNSSPAPFSLAFNVDVKLMGLAIGSRGSNIKNAKNLKNVLSIDVVDELGNIVVKGRTEEACIAAREMLEYVEDTLDIPRAYVGRVIGRRGNNIQKLVDMSGVLKIRVLSGNENGETIDTVPFVFTGTCEKVRHAQLLVEDFIKELNESDRMKWEQENVRHQDYE